MKKALSALAAAAAAIVLITGIMPVQAEAAKKKTVYVIESITVKNTSGRTIDTITYKYNKRGMVTQRTWKMPGGTNTNKYTYDDDLNLITETALEGKKKTSVTKYKYQDGKLTKAVLTYYSPKEKLNLWYEYDKKDRLKLYDGDSTPETSFKYNDKGLLIQKSVLYNYPNAKPEKAKYEYNSKGNVTKHYEYGGLFRKYSYTYTGKRVKTATAYYKSGKKICTEYIQYKKMSVSKEDAVKVAARQVQYFRDPVFQMFPY